MSNGVKLEEAAFDKKDLSDCQTSCCIAGAATQFFDKTWLDTLIAERLSTGELDADDLELPFYGSYGVFYQAQELLDLDDEQAENLFTPGGRYTTSFAEYNNPAWAARTICHLIATDEPTRGIYNEFLRNDLDKRRKVFEVLGNRTKCPVSTEQLSGLGFSSTQRNTLTVRVKGTGLQATYNINF